MNNFDLLKERIESYVANIPRNSTVNIFSVLSDLLDYAEDLVENGNDGWVSIDDGLPTHSDQYWVAYHPISNYNPNEKTKELCYCTAHFNEYEKVWSVKDQLLYTQRHCKVLFWQPLPKPSKEQ